jgi:transposase
LDPLSGTRISPLVAAAVYIKPRLLLTERQIGMLEVLQEMVPGFTTMRSLAIHFRGLLPGEDVGKLDNWITDARSCGIPWIAHFARTLMHGRSPVVR